MWLHSDEKLALMTLIEKMRPDQFRHLVYRATFVSVTEFMKSEFSMMDAAVELMGWLNTNVHHAPAILKLAVESFPDHESTPSLRLAEARLRSLQAKQDALGPAHKAVLAAGFPVVNREFLRTCLAAPEELAVVMVEGDSGLGRSHSWHLIRHIASALPKVKPILIDLVGPLISQRTLPWIFNYLVRVLPLPAGETPTTEGITGETLSDRFMSEFMIRLQSMDTPWPKMPWLVFDHLDRNIAPEIKRFVMGITSQRLAGIFDGFVIFLLGPDPAVPLVDRAALARRESLTDLLDNEIVAAAERLNKIGHTPLAGVELERKLEALKDLRNGRTGRELANAVFAEMVTLRQIVGAA